MSPLVVWWGLLVANVCCAIGWLWACWRLRRLDEWHHIYIGTPLVCIPWSAWIGWWALIPWLLGIWIVADDADLHLHQALVWKLGDRPLTGADDEASFWHRMAHRVHAI